MNTMRTEPIWSAIREILWLQLKKCERMHCHDKIKSWLFYMTETKKLMNISVWNFNSSSVLDLVENYINSICHFGVRLRTSRTFLVFLILRKHSVEFARRQFSSQLIRSRLLVSLLSSFSTFVSSSYTVYNITSALAFSLGHRPHNRLTFRRVTRLL